ncbi:hypothetical protein ICW40_06680 [Actinotalea ferrariae]|uniref:hypothetical protein n=1 Tax=Actinotalea ferrariae TaxID=1386098 RepID=UPI001C8C4101|nr:hypothetical protein [Actinotalea ferrariae]MBX9244491.1 hypothetical protein [Actinotalea ferrariae]
MRHPDDAVLRRLVHEPAGVADTDREHVTACPQCLDGLAIVAGRPHPGGAPTVPGADRRDARSAPRTRGGDPLWRRPAVAVTAFAVVLAGAGAAAANDWLPIFRTEEVVPLEVGADDLVDLPDLSAYGDVVVTQDGDVEAVQDAATAAARTGLEIPEPTTLPRGVTGEPAVQVGGEVEATFTFSAERAARAAADAGETLPPTPAGLDGSQVRMVAGPGVALTWSHPSGAPSLVVARAVAPTASSSGVSFETVRDHVLSLPGVPEDLAAQLRAFPADGSTLPLPVPADRATSSTVDVGGVPATVVETHDRSMAAVVQVEDGVVTVVAGPLGADEVLAVLRDLR